MFCASLKSVLLVLLSVLVRGVLVLDYSDLEALGVACPERDKCAGYRNNRDYTDRSCECDNDCRNFRDCCIDADARQTSTRIVASTGRVCMNYGEHSYTGVYAIANCSSNWQGPQQIRENCEGSTNFSDPMLMAPVINVAQNVTYKNRYCAECNHVNMDSLKSFLIKLMCDDGLDHLTQEQIMADMIYKRSRNIWGVNKLNSGGIPEFVECAIVFDVPGYLNWSVRFCRPNLVSRCARNWTRPGERRKCQAYMAVVYDTRNAYRNPECAICNNKRLSDISCDRTTMIDGRRTTMFMVFFRDINPSDKPQDATPQCPSTNQTLDPFKNSCRDLGCAMPGTELVDGRCTRVES